MMNCIIINNNNRSNCMVQYNWITGCWFFRGRVWGVVRLACDPRHHTCTTRPGGGGDDSLRTRICHCLLLLPLRTVLPCGTGVYYYTNFLFILTLFYCCRVTRQKAYEKPLIAFLIFTDAVLSLFSTPPLLTL